MRTGEALRLPDGCDSRLVSDQDEHNCEEEDGAGFYGYRVVSLDECFSPLLSPRLSPVGTSYAWRDIRGSGAKL